MMLSVSGGRMPELPFCFSDYGVQVADSLYNGGNSAHNVVTCLYKTFFGGAAHVLAINWYRSLVGQGLSVNVEDVPFPLPCKVDMKPWMFWKRKGSKAFEMEENTVKVYWDLSAAKYGASPEPIEGFFVAVVSHHETLLLLGDMDEEAYKRTMAKPPVLSEPSLISRREHMFGKRLYSTTAQVGELGRTHEIEIECQNASGRKPRLCVRVDHQLVMQVKRLMWKFRGNQTIIVDGCPVELLWDVHSWLFSPTHGHAVFMFQASQPNLASMSMSLFQWPVASTSIVKEKGDAGSCLIVYAWKSE